MSEKESFETASHKQQQAAGMFVGPPMSSTIGKSGDCGPQANYYQKAKLILPTAVWVLVIVGGLCFLSVLSSLNKTISTLDNLIEVERAEMKEYEKHEANPSSIVDSKPWSRVKADPLQSSQIPVSDSLPKLPPATWLDLPPWASLEPRSPALGPHSILDDIMRVSQPKDESLVSGGVVISSSSNPESMISDIMESLAAGPSIAGSPKSIDGLDSAPSMLTANIDTININMAPQKSKSNRKKIQPLADKLPSIFMKGSQMDDFFPWLGSPLMNGGPSGGPNVIQRVVTKAFDGPIKSDPFGFSPSFEPEPLIIASKHSSLPEMIIAVGPSDAKQKPSKQDKGSGLAPQELNFLGMPSIPLSQKKRDGSLFDYFPVDSTPKSFTNKPSDDMKDTSKSLLDLLFGPPLESASGIVVSKVPFSLDSTSKPVTSSDDSPSKIVTEVLVDGSSDSKSDLSKSKESSQATTPREDRWTDDIFSKSIFIPSVESLEGMSTAAQSKDNQGAIKVASAKTATTSTTAKPAAAGAKSATTPSASTSAKSSSTLSASSGGKATSPASAKLGPTTPASSSATKSSSTTPSTNSTTQKTDTRKSRSVTESTAIAFDDKSQATTSNSEPTSDVLTTISKTIEPVEELRGDDEASWKIFTHGDLRNTDSSKGSSASTISVPITPESGQISSKLKDAGLSIFGVSENAKESSKTDEQKTTQISSDSTATATLQDSQPRSPENVVSSPEPSKSADPITRQSTNKEEPKQNLILMAAAPVLPNAKPEETNNTVTRNDTKPHQTSQPIFKTFIQKADDFIVRNIFNIKRLLS